VDFVKNRLLPKPETNRQQSRLLPYTFNFVFTGLNRHSRLNLKQHVKELASHRGDSTQTKLLVNESKTGGIVTCSRCRWRHINWTTSTHSVYDRPAMNSDWVNVGLTWGEMALRRTSSHQQHPYACSYHKHVANPLPTSPQRSIKIAWPGGSHAVKTPDLLRRATLAGLGPSSGRTGHQLQRGGSPTGQVANWTSNRRMMMVASFIHRAAAAVAAFFFFFVFTHIAYMPTSVSALFPSRPNNYLHFPARIILKISNRWFVAMALNNVVLVSCSVAYSALQALLCGVYAVASLARDIGGDGHGSRAACHGSLLESKKK